MVQRRRCFRLDFKSFLLFILSCDLAGQKLDGNRALKLGVLRFVDDAHAAAAKFFENLVMEYSFAYHELISNFVIVIEYKKVTFLKKVTF